VRTALAIATTLLAALLWVAALIVEPKPFAPAPALLIGVGLLSMASVATVGMIVVGGRWAHRLGLAALGVTVVLAVARDIDVVWSTAIGASILATIGILSPTVTRTIRRLPSAAGPSPRAVLPVLILLSAPALLGLTANDASPWALLVVGLTAPGVALLYSRVLPGGLIAIRLAWPALAIGLAPWLGVTGGLTSALLGVAVAVLAWDRTVRASYHPPREVGTTFPIPPELAPKEVLDAAELDERGRPR